MVESGELRRNVDLRVYDLRGRDFSMGLGELSGIKNIELPELETDEYDEEIVDWGCGVFAARVILKYVGEETDTRKLTEMIYDAGGKTSGLSGEVLSIVLHKKFGLEVCERKILTPDGISAALGEGYLLTTIMTQDWNKLYRSRLQSYESHWVVIPGVDLVRPRVVIVDSNMGDDEVGGNEYGVYTMTFQSFFERNVDFYEVEGGFISRSGDYLWGSSRWYGNYFLIIKNKR